jgi:cytochrome c oxidase subunit I
MIIIKVQEINIENPSLTKKWLFLSVFALATSGVFSILLVLSRTPLIQEIIPIKNLFHTALIIHVDLSVLVWMLAIACMLWSSLSNIKYNKICNLFFYLSLAGTLLIIISPFVPNDGKPIINNYIPMLPNAIFIIGLSLFLAGILFSSLYIVLFEVKYQFKDIVHLGSYISSLMVLLSFVCFVLASISLDQIISSRYISLEYYYELLFWGGGHVLQFVYTQIMLIAWMVLATNNTTSSFLQNRVIKFLFILNFIFVAPVIVVYFVYEVNDWEIQNFFTQHMRYLGAIIPFFIGLFISYTLVKYNRRVFSPTSSSLYSSIILFACGGIIGIAIGESNVTIPAHYHGVIVGVTLALMGLVFLYIQILGYNITLKRLAISQPIIYGGGQLLHILGLAWSGGYGAMRKSAETIIDMQIRIGMGLMGLGGLVAIIGGLLFVYIIYNTVRGNNHNGYKRTST